MRVKDLIWKLQQIHNKEKEVYFGSCLENEKRIGDVIEKEFRVYIIKF